jgi:hypothetical protein
MAARSRMPAPSVPEVKCSHLRSYTPFPRVGLTPHWRKQNWLLRTFGERQLMAQLIARRVLVSLLIHKDFLHSIGFRGRLVGLG